MLLYPWPADALAEEWFRPQEGELDYLVVEDERLGFPLLVLPHAWCSLSQAERRSKGQ